MNFWADIVFYFSEGWLNFKRSKGTTLVSVFIIAVSIAIITVFSTFFVNIDSYLSRMKKNPYVSVFLKKNASESDINILFNRLATFDGVRNLKKVSPDKGLKMLYQKFGYLKDSDKLLKENPLPYSIVFKIKVEKLPEVRAFLDNYGDIVDEVYTPFDLFLKVQEIAGGFSLFATVLTLVLIVSSIITVYNVIRITIVSRKEDIAIMQLVGANLKYIRMPFVVEGFLQGLLGGILGVIAGDIAVLHIVSNYFAKVNSLSFLSDIAVLPFSMQLKIAGLSVLFGIVGSLIASLQIDYS